MTEDAPSAVSARAPANVRTHATGSSVFHQHLDVSRASMHWVQTPTLIGPGVTHRSLMEAFRRLEALVVSYPRAGRTWVRAMLAHAFEHAMDAFSAHPMDVTGWTRVEPKLPRLILTHGRVNPRLHTPASLPTDRSWASGHRVLLLARDPRDLIVSLWHERTHRIPLMRPHRAPSPMTMSELLRADEGGLRTVVAYYNIWARNRGVPRDLMLVKYEHLINDAELECGRMLRWLGVPTAPGTVEEAVRATSFATLRRMETSGRLGYKPTSGLLGNDEAMIMRRGAPGGYHDHFTRADLDYAREVMATLDPWYGYSAE